MSLTKIPGFALDTTSNVTFANANVTGNLSSGNANLGNAATANYFIGNGSLLTGLPASYANSNVASYLPTFSGNLTAGNANLGNLTTSNYFSGNGSLLTGISVSTLANGNSNVSIPSSNGNVTISAVGNANIAIITGTGVNVTGYLNATGNITGANANLGNLIIANYYQGTLTTSAQPNITSVGTLTSLSVTGNITSGNANLGNLVKANYFQGDGGLLSNVPGAWYIANGTSNMYAVTNGNITANIGGNNSLIITSTGANITGYANISGNISAGNLSLSGNVTSTLNVTGNANVGNLNTTGSVTANNLTLTGNLIVGGTTTYINSTVTDIVDPLIELGGGANGALLTAGDAKDRGLVLHRYEGIAGSGGFKIDSFMGWSNSAYEYVFASNASVSSDVVTVNSYGNVHANYFIGNGSALTGIAATTAVSLINGTSNAIVTNNGNITFGIGGNASMLILTSTGANFGGYITTAGNVAANYFIGNGSQLTGLGGLSNGTSNISIPTQNGNVIISVAGNYSILQVGSAGTNASGYLNLTGNLIANTITSNGFANITGTITAANANLGNLATANYFNGTLAALSSSQPNIQTVGTLNYLNVSTANSGNGTVTANIVTATYIKGDGSNLTGIGGAGYIFNANSNVAIPSANSNVYVTVGSTSNVVVFSTGGINANGYANFTGNLAIGGNANLGNVATANYFKGDGSNLTGIGGAGYIFNGNSNVAIPSANSNIYFTVGSTSNVVTVSTGGINANGYANFTGNLLVGTNANITGNLTASNITSGNLVTSNYFSGKFDTNSNAQPNITSLGTLLNLTITSTANIGGNVFIGNTTSNITLANTGAIIATGNITAPNANLGNLVTANYTNAVLTTGAQPNITGIGTLGNLVVTNNVSANTLTTGSGTNGNLTISPDGTGNLIIGSNTRTILSNSLSSNGNVALSGANVSLGAISNVHITGGSTNQYLKTDGTGNLSWGTPSGGGGGGTGLTYTAAATPPSGPNVADQWYNTSSNTLYEYLSDGTTSYWIDIQTPTVSSAITNGSLIVQLQGTNLTPIANTINFVGGGDSVTASANVVTVNQLSPFLLMGA